MTTLLFIYFITVNKYRFCISVIGYINMQIIDIGYKRSISVDHYFQPIICLTRDLTALDAILLRPNKDSGAGFFQADSAPDAG